MTQACHPEPRLPARERRFPPTQRPRPVRPSPPVVEPSKVTPPHLTDAWAQLR